MAFNLVFAETVGTHFLSVSSSSEETKAADLDPSWAQPLNYHEALDNSTDVNFTCEGDTPLT